MWREWPFWRDLGVDWSGRPAVRPARNSIGALLRLFGPRWPAVLWVALNVVFGASLGVLPCCPPPSPWAAGRPTPT